MIPNDIKIIEKENCDSKRIALGDGGLAGRDLPPPVPRIGEHE